LHEHDYVARRVRTEPSPAIELCFHGQLNTYHTEVLQGVVEAATDAAVAVVVSVRPRGPRSPGPGGNRPPPWVGGVAAAGRRGAIVVTSEVAAADLRALSRARTPVVVIDPLHRPSPRVTSRGGTNF